MNRINKLFEVKKKGVLSIFMTAGYPDINDTAEIIKSLEKKGVDLIEIGIPFSDPVADGPAIQNSSAVALKNGMNIHLLFEQLQNIRNTVTIPLILMGYINPILQFGIEKFCQKASECGIDGFIIPDLPLEIYLKEWKMICDQYNIKVIFLITQETSEERIRKIDQSSESFIYMVTSAGTTGGGLEGNEDQIKYFEHIKKMELSNPIIAGFGVSKKQDLELIGNYANGAIVGSHFIRAIGKDGSLEKKISGCLEQLIR